MSLPTIDYDAAWEAFADKVQVTYLPYDTDLDRPNEPAAVSGIDARIEMIGKKEITSPDGVAVFVASRTWDLRVSQLDGTPVTKRGVIREADGTEWAVESAELKTRATRYRCETHARGC